VSSNFILFGFRSLFIILLIENFYFRFKNKSPYSRFKDTAFWQLLLGFLLLNNSIDNAKAILSIMQTSIIVLFCIFLIELIKIRMIKRKNIKQTENPN